MSLPLSQLQALESLWESAGGAPGFAPQMAAIADAESGGNQGASNSYVDGNGTTQAVYGLWQISTVHAGALAAAGITGWQLPSGSFANAEAAVDVSGNGANLTPWQAWDGYLDVVNGTNTSGLTAAQKQQAYATIAADLQTLGGANVPSPAAQTAQSATASAPANADPYTTDNSFQSWVYNHLYPSWLKKASSGDAQKSAISGVGLVLLIAGIGALLIAFLLSGGSDEQVVVTAPAQKRPA